MVNDNINPFNKRVVKSMINAGWKPLSKESRDKLYYKIANKNGWPTVQVPKEKELEAWKKYEERRKL